MVSVLYDILKFCMSKNIDCTCMHEMSMLPLGEGEEPQEKRIDYVSKN